jgi:hypothetical protein
VGRHFIESGTPLGELIENWVRAHPTRKMETFAATLAPLAAQTLGRQVPVDHLTRLIRIWRRQGSMPRGYRLDAARVLGVSLALLEDKIDQHRSRYRTAAQHTGAPVRPRPDPEHSASFASPTLAATLIPHRIRYTYEPEFEQFLQIFRDELEGQILDTVETLEIYLRDAETYRAQELHCDEVYLVAKFAEKERLNGVVAAILYASYYPTLDFLYISYLALDTGLYNRLQEAGDYASAAEIRFKATNVLLRSMAEIVKSDVSVLLESLQDQRNDYRKSLFSGYASRLFHSQLYQINVPNLLPVDLSDLDQSSDLIYLPGSRQREAIRQNKDHLPRDEVLTIAEFLYNYVYEAYYIATGQHDIYRENADELLFRLREQLPNFVSVTPLKPR